MELNNWTKFTIQIWKTTNFNNYFSISHVCICICISIHIDTHSDGDKKYVISPTPKRECIGTIPTTFKHKHTSFLDHRRKSTNTVVFNC